MSSQHEREVEAGDRFAFGKNWANFLKLLDAHRVEQAEQSLREKLLVTNLTGKNFLDVGCGSGLFSLAARRLGASVHSFDFDPQAVACANELKCRFFGNDSEWKIEHGTALDERYLATLGQFDVVYSWGVLHHTGSMYQAFQNIIPLVNSKGLLFISIYNDQGLISKYWSLIKRIYNKNMLGRWLILVIHAPYLIGTRFLFRVLTGGLQLERGMSLWHDMIDWLGGFPFEVAKPESIFHFFMIEGLGLLR